MKRDRCLSSLGARFIRRRRAEDKTRREEWRKTVWEPKMRPIWRKNYAAVRARRKFRRWEAGDPKVLPFSFAEFEALAKFRKAKALQMAGPPIDFAVWFAERSARKAQRLAEQHARGVERRLARIGRQQSKAAEEAAAKAAKVAEHVARLAEDPDFEIKEWLERQWAKVEAKGLGKRPDEAPEPPRTLSEAIRILDDARES